MSVKIIQKNIKWIATTAAKVNVTIHETALLILKQANEHGDCSYAQHLFNAMPASHRRLMLKAWFETFSPIRLNLKDENCIKVGMLKADQKGFTPFDIDGSTATSFFDMAKATPEKAPLDFAGLVALVTGLSKRMDKMADEGKVTDEDLPSARAISAQLASLKLVRVNPANDEKPAAKAA